MAGAYEALRYRLEGTPARSPSRTVVLFYGRGETEIWGEMGVSSFTWIV